MNEITEEILNRFNDSWTATETHFQHLIDEDPAFNRLIPVYSFIKSLKKSGKHKHFRLGASMDKLIISRSVDTRLRQEQKFILLKATEKDFTITLKDGTKMYREYTVKDLDDERVTSLLQTLQSTLID